ncbi:MAG: hypothetical protein ACOC8H_00550 [bacterium]
MHAYASDSIDRRIVPWIIAVVAIAVVFLYHVFAGTFRFALPWWCEAPSIMLVYGLVHWGYDQKLWRQQPFGLLLSQIPNCAGTWFGQIESTYDGGTTAEGMLVIHQTWKKMLVEFRTDGSTSYSRMASLNVTPGASQGLIYEYSNDPRATATAEMHAHRGFAFLRLSVDGQQLEGDYYTGRDRTSQGTLHLRLVSREELTIQQARQEYQKTVKQ